MKPLQTGFFLLLVTSPLFSQTRLALQCNLGYSYFLASSSPGDSWNFNQKSISLSLGGSVLSPRFLEFQIGGDYSGTSYDEKAGISDYSLAGYRVQTDFFSARRINFGLGLGKQQVEYDPDMQGASPFKKHSFFKRFHFNMLRLKLLPDIRLDYRDYVHQSAVSQASDDRKKKIEINANESSGISQFDLRYRLEDNKNPFLGFNQKHQSLNAHERLDFSPDSKLFLQGRFFRSSFFSRIGNSEVKANSGNFSANSLNQFSKNLNSRLSYAFVMASGKGYRSLAHSVFTSLNWTVSKHIILSPALGYSTSAMTSPQLEENSTSPHIGLRLSLQGDLRKIKLNSQIGFSYFHHKSDQSPDMKNFSKSLALSLISGKTSRLLGSLSYQFQDVDIDRPEEKELSLESPFSLEIGQKQNSHLVHLELTSNALWFKPLHVYSRYQRFKTRYAFQGIRLVRILTNRVRLGLKHLSLHAGYEISRLNFGDQASSFRSYSATIDVRLIKGLELRALTLRRVRTDVLFFGDFESRTEVFLKYNLNDFSFSANYRRFSRKVVGIEFENEALFFRISRRFGVRFL